MGDSLTRALSEVYSRIDGLKSTGELRWKPSVLEYAREQGICVDYTTELPRLLDICLSLKDTLDQDLRDSFEHEITNATTAAHELTKERLALNKEAALLLKIGLTLREPPNDDLLTADARQTRNLKLELPILQTDAELDMLNFGTRIDPDFKDLRTRLPSEDLDEENDEGFGWPAKYSAYPLQCDAKIKSEKLAMTRDALTLLQDAVKDDFSTQDREELMVEETKRKSHLVPRHLTPPLLPLSPPVTPYIPSSPANQLPVIPESSDSITAEAKALEQQIMAKDSLIRRHSGSSDSMLLDVADLDALFDAQDEQAVSPIFPDRITAVLKSKRKADELRVEGPLTPPILSDSPMKKLKSVTFSNMIQVGDSVQPWSGDNPSSDSHSATEELIKEIEPIVKEANRKVENEKLTGADTISRVDIPVLDFALPVAPWDEYSQRKEQKRRPDITELEAQTRFLQCVKRDDLKSATVWRGVSDIDLRWGWFASPSSTIKLNEKLHGEIEFSKIQAELKTGNIATSTNEVWKKDGLRVLNEEEDDGEDDIEVAEFEDRNDMEALVRKRRLELQEYEEILETQRKGRQAAAVWEKRYGSPQQQALPAHSQDPPRARHASQQSRLQESTVPLSQLKPAEKHKNTPTELMFGGFSASTALHKFMETQGKAIKSAETTAQMHTPAADPAQTISTHNKAPSVKSSLLIAQKPDCKLEDPSHQMSVPAPPLDLPPSSFIVSSSLLQRRPFLKQIESLHPKAEFIYRDYNLRHSAATEADIILSPSTGVLLTTLQQIKQAPLPGQAARSLVKERMMVLQARYERLIVLVSESLREDSGFARPEDARDKDTLMDLEVFAEKLGGEVLVSFVRGGEHMLARGVVENMAKYGLPHGGEDIGDIKLFDVETTWEVFLRRAGFNPFAAQIILASLKVPTIMPLPDLARGLAMISPTSAYAPQKTVETAGLPVFLLMERQDRIKHFQAIMGGRRILDRVSALLDRRWLSASDGYRM
ncbi:hypothetical protein E8E12_002913 [Didymella heteroderae]|uniref:Uncharacterized protein n=1 Tax=Didymella heteroderae TaxID=1769908 RepID=A0A9P4WWZ2_9PLEO|nr:hypothetical protein E8E12_002913 [Didymella heteroderae]